MQLVVTTAPDVIGSWGISRLSAKQIVRNINGYDFTMAALILNVDGFLFQGNVYVALDEGCDYYRIYFEKDVKLEEKRVDIAFDELGGVLDSLIESGGMSKQEYDAAMQESAAVKRGRRIKVLFAVSVFIFKSISSRRARRRACRM